MRYWLQSKFGVLRSAQLWIWFRKNRIGKSVLKPLVIRVAQQLYFTETPKRQPALHYWLREGRANNAEVDFLLQIGQVIVPVEVKAGKGGTLKSLFQFADAKGSPFACRFDLNLPTRQTLTHRLAEHEVAVELVSLPLYLCGQANRLLGELLLDGPA